MTEAVVVICPNPKCQREIEEPILLTILSVTPPKKYEACPYCFAKIEQQEAPIIDEQVPEPTIEQEETIEIYEQDETEDNLPANNVLDKVKDSGFLKRVKSLIPITNGTKNETKEKIQEPKAEPAVEAEENLEEETETESFFDDDEETIEDFQTDDFSDDEEAVATEESNTEKFAKEGNEPSGCPETFGYLANRPKDVSIPQGCLTCPKMVDCMLSPRNE